MIKFNDELLLWICPRIINALRSYVKQSKKCFIRFRNTSKLVKKNSAAPRFFNPLFFLSSSCLFYYVKELKLWPLEDDKRSSKTLTCKLLQWHLFSTFLILFRLKTSTMMRNLTLLHQSWSQEHRKTHSLKFIDKCLWRVQDSHLVSCMSLVRLFAFFLEVKSASPSWRSYTDQKVVKLRRVLC